MLRRACALGLTGLAVACAGEPPIPEAGRTKMRADLSERVSALTQAIAETPGVVALYSRRGDCRLFLGRFAEAIADFEKMIALDPAQDDPHWRLGIAYYFAGQHAKSARQFEKYHSHDGGDRENGIWKFLGDVKVHGLERARREMLVYTRFDREPFPALYELLAGKKSTAEFLADLESRQLTANPRVMFFANYYAGLHEEILGHREQALAYLHAAVANPWGRTAEGGPAYMWQVARVHYDMLSTP
ncbi:MAG TPA: tetratricopeptide repeat protein [Opitutaceae bacterium]|nr:tetratricopeptide repeat protein [Opitutaceae bacterium]